MGGFEFLVWEARFEAEANEFNPLWWYLARIAWEVHRTAPEKGWGASFEDFLLEFVTETENAGPQTAEEATALAKARWRGAWSGG